MACIAADTSDEPMQSRVEKCCERIFSHCEHPCIKPPKINPELAPAVENSRMAYKIVTESTPTLIKCITRSADDDLNKNTKHLEDRAIDVAKWQGEIESLIRKLREEITLTDALRLRVQQALKVLVTAENINSECKARRNSRTGHDFIPDCVDAALAEETRFCEQVRHELTLFLTDIDSQMDMNKTCKIQLEFDWSDKNESHRLETINIGLRKKGPISFFPGATRLQENQATPAHWLHYTKEQICQGCAVLERSFCLRKNTEEALSKYAADLRTLADKVELSIQDNIAATQQALQETEEELKRVLSEITNAETLKPKLKLMVREVDLNLKVAQTRLNHRAARPRNENTRDVTQADLICEVQHLNQDGMDLKSKMDEATETLEKLYKSRRILEDTISVKRKSLYIDRERCLFYRSKFPDCLHLAGF